LEDKGSKTIVLQLGSHSIKMGFANEKAPFTILPCIAYRAQKKEPETKISEEEFDYEWFKEEYLKMEGIMKAEGIISPDNRPFKGKPRAKQVVNIDRIPNYSPDSTTLYGEEALRVESNPDFIFRKVFYD
jgi:actin-related protein